MLKVTNKKSFDLKMNSSVRVLFIVLALLPIGYGAIILLDYKAFFNNSVATTGIVVNMEPTAVAMPQRVIDGIQQGDYGPNETFFIPGFFYTHENGASYIGGAMTDASGWDLKPGQVMEIRYHRGHPNTAQPVSLREFWLAPVAYIGGGLLFVSLILGAFLLTYIKRQETKPLNLRRTTRLNVGRR